MNEIDRTRPEPKGSGSFLLRLKARTCPPRRNTVALQPITLTLGNRSTDLSMTIHQKEKARFLRGGGATSSLISACCGLCLAALVLVCSQAAHPAKAQAQQWQSDGWKVGATTGAFVLGAGSLASGIYTYAYAGGSGTCIKMRPEGCVERAQLTTADEVAAVTALIAGPALIGLGVWFATMGVVGDEQHAANDSRDLAVTPTFWIDDKAGALGVHGRF